MIALVLVTALGLAPDAPVDAAASSLESLSKQQLENELLHLQQHRPRLVEPIVFISAGTVAALGGLTLLNIGAALVFSKPALVASILIGGGALLLFGGAFFAIVGIVKIGRRLAERKTQNLKMEELEKRLDAIDRLSKLDWVGCNQTVLATF